MAAEDGLQLPVGVTEKQFMQQLARMESRLVKMEGDQKSRFQNSNKAVSKSFRDLDQSVSGSLKAMAASAATTSKAFITAFAGAAITAAFAGLGGKIVSTIKSIAQLGDEAKRAGVEVEAFQQWGYVARQNRIDIGALTDGFKELNLRADEFVVTGKGSAAEAFLRLGYSATDLKQKLQDPSNLMLEIIGRLEGLDKAAQIRIADELFGGTGGERFVELLGQGEAGIRKVMEEAKNSGAVIDSELVQRADELDKRFAAIQERLKNGFKNSVISLADMLFGDKDRDLADLMSVFEQIRTALGEESFNALIKADAFAEESAASIAALNDEMRELSGTARELATMYFELADAAFALGDADTGKALAEAGAEMDKLVAAFKRGEINAGELITRMMGVKTEADAVVAAISDTNAQSLADIIAQVDGLSSALGMAAGLAQRLWSIMGGGGGGEDEGGDAGLSRNPFDVGGEPMTSSPRPQRPGVDSYGDWVDDNTPKTKGGKGGGGKGKGNNRLEALVQDLKTEEEILTDWYEKSLELLAEANDKELEVLGGYHAAKERLEEEHLERLAGIQQTGNSARLAEMGNFFGAMASLTAAGGDKLVKATRVFGAAEALVNTFRAQSQVLADPRLGFFGKMAAYASIGAAGFGLVAALRGGGKGGGGAGGASSAAAAAEPAQSPQKVANYQITGDVLGKQSTEQLFKDINQGIKDGYTIHNVEWVG